MARITFDPYQVPLDRTAARVFVWRYDPDADEEERYTWLPNVRCEAIGQREGAEPGSAEFRYAFDPQLGDPQAPSRVEHVYSLDATGPYVLHHDERIVVGRLRADGSLQLLFDGFAQIPQATLSSAMEAVTFQALATPCRCWDTPIGGAVFRNADKPEDIVDTTTGRPTRFNDQLKANATDEDQDSGPDDRPYPVFLDPLVCASRKIGRTWSIGMAVRYLIMVGNPGEEYVENPPFFAPGVFLPDETIPVLENTLSAIVPVPDGGTIDWSDLNTFSLEPIPAPAYDATGKAWPEAVEELISPHGFGLAFRLSVDGGEPKWTAEIYRKDRPQRLKALLLAKAGGVLDPGRANVSQLKLQRDVSHLANEWIVDTEPKRYEASFVLAAGFVPDVADDVVPTPKKFNRGGGDAGEGANAYDTVKYRRYVFDEAGDEHWGIEYDLMVANVATPLDDVFGDDIYALRRRPGLGTLFSTDSRGIARKAMLHVSTDYAGPKPGVWDRTGHWQEVKRGDWELLKDRLGITLTMPKPQDWNIGDEKGTNKPFPTGKVKLITEMTRVPPPGKVIPTFRLTCVIEGDQDIAAVAKRRGASPTKFVVQRRDDSRDRFKLQMISRHSYLSDGKKDVAARDDTEKAGSHAAARRRSRESARFAGSVVIPRFTDGYRIGDRIRRVRGREIDLRTNVGVDEESPEYATVVGIDWTFAGRNATILQLSDRRAEVAAAGAYVGGAGDA